MPLVVASGNLKEPRYWDNVTHACQQKMRTSPAYHIDCIDVSAVLQEELHSVEMAIVC